MTEEEEIEQPVIQDNEIPVDKIVKFIRMKNGTDLVTQLMTFHNEDDEYYHIFVCPLEIIMKDVTGKFSFVLKEWVYSEFCAEQEFTIYPDEILTIGSASPILIDYYFDSLDRLHMNNSLKGKVNKNVVVDDKNLKTISQGIPIHANSVFDLSSVNVHRKVRN